METLSFDGLVENYSNTRDFDIVCFNHALDYITTSFPPKKFKHIFEPGIGNGRTAIPLAQKGYKITGIDVSKEMLSSLSKNMRSNNVRNIVFSEGSATSIPFRNNQFDLSIAVHLFYFIRDWKKACDEIARVTKDAIILLHTGMGKEVDQINAEYKKICIENGTKFPLLGVTSTSEVTQYLKDKGYKIAYDKKWEWEKIDNPIEVINYIENRSYSFTLWANNATHIKAVNHLRKKYIEPIRTKDRVSIMCMESDLTIAST